MDVELSILQKKQADEKFKQRLALSALKEEERQKRINEHEKEYYERMEAQDDGMDDDSGTSIWDLIKD